MITAKNIHKRYGEVEVLRGVDMQINKGEIVAIVGPSGSGKSTLLHILGTLDHPDQGHIEAGGIKIEYQPKLQLTAASWWKRFLNHTLDQLLIAVITYGVITIFSLVPENYIQDLSEDLPRAYSWKVFLVHLLVYVIYYTLLEGLTGRSPAKYITNTKIVVADEGTRPGLLSCFIRSAARLLPFEFISYFSKRPVGWHDSLAGTMVVDNTLPYATRLANTLTPKELSMFRNRNMGFVFQFHHLLPEFSALENVCIPGWLAGRKKNEVRAEAEQLLSLLSLTNRMDNKPNQLSGGEQQRVAVARALINKPDIVFADEPTGNLDSANARELHQLFFELRKQFNQTFLIVTHNEELAKLSDRVLYMKDGKIV